MTGAVKLDATDIYYNGFSAVASNRVKYQIDLRAPKISPNFSGTPTAPTAPYGNNSFQIATTAFVQNALGGISSGGLSIKVSISSAQLLNLNSSPVTVISAPGAGKVIEVMNCMVKYNFGTTPYVCAGGLTLRNPSSTLRQLNIAQNIIQQTFSTITHTNSYDAGNDTAIVVNEPIQFEAKTANPTSGDGTVDLYIYYRIVTL